MAENLKQKLNKINLLKSIVYSAISWSYANCTFAMPKEENLSDEIFDAAMQVEASADKYNGITNVVDSPAVDSAMEQIRDEAMVSGTDVLNNTVNSFQNIGSSLGDNIDAVTGGNPLFTKILVVFILVFISICIIVVLIILAKKFVFKKTINPFVAANDMNLEERFDESKFEDDELPADDDDEKVLDDEQTQGIKRTSHTMIPPKNMIERDIETVEQEYVMQTEDAAILQGKQELQNREAIQINNETDVYLKIKEPKDIASAMQIFLKVTAE